MTNITWKNGGPLFLQPTPTGDQFGLFAAGNGCCCPPPPPPRCWDCLDPCAYFIEVTAPSAVAVKSPPRNCGESGSCRDVDVDYLLEDSLPDEFSEEISNNSSGKACSGTRSGVSHQRTAHVVGEFSNSLRVYAAISASINCVPERSPTPFYVSLGANVFVTMGFRADEYGAAQWIANGEYNLESSCQTAPDRQCNDYQGEFRILNTPVEFSADGEGTSFGPYQDSGSSSGGARAADAEAVRDAIRDAITATFRITSRESCLPPCEPCPRQQLCHDLHENFPETLAVGLDTCQNYSANEFGGDGVTADGGEYYLGGPTFGIGIFEPGGSPFLNGAFAKIEDRFVDLGGGNWELQRTTTPQTIDDCNNDGTDCNWADYEKALEYWDQGADIFVWGDLGVTTESSGGGLGPNGSSSFMNAYHYKFRAYVSCDGGWVDKTAELLKRTELKYYYLVVGGAQSVEIPVTYRSPLQPGIVCLENPLP